MGRKRKTRWRHLSIGEVSGNEEEDDETQQAQGEGSEFPSSYGYRHHKSHSLNSIHRHRSASLTFKDRDSAGAGRFNSKMSSGSGAVVSDKTGATNGYCGKDKDKDSDKGHSEKGHGEGSGDSEVKESSDGGGGVGDVPNRRQHSPYNGHYGSHRHSSYNNPHQYHNGYHHHSSYDKDGSGAGGGSRPYHHQNGHGGGSGEYSNGNYYHRSNSYNNYRSSHYDGSGGHHGGRGGGGGSDYHFQSRYSDRGGGGFRGRIRRSYSSYNSYYGGSSGNGNGSQQANGEGNPNTPSYNQEEYTKITTPRQDVLFKKGYLSQRKSAAQSSSLESTSTPTTPSASTNGTPDTHSTAGINSDYSEGYENGETDGSGGVGGSNAGAAAHAHAHAPPYVGVGADDTVYYGPPAEAAVFTDPHTGQVYYGQCSSTGEFFDAYPVSPVMLACPNGQGGIFYQLAYPPPLDWNGVPQLFPLAVAPPMGPAPGCGDEGGMLLNGSGVGGCSSAAAAVQGSSEISDSIAKNISKIKEFRPAASSAPSASGTSTSTTTNSSGASSTSSSDASTEVPAAEDAHAASANSTDSKSAGNNNNKNYSSNNNTNTNTTSKQAMAMNSLSAQMSSLNVNGSSAPFNGHGHGHIPALPGPPSHPHGHQHQHLPLPNYMASVPVHHHHHQQHHQHPPQQQHLPPVGAGGPPQNSPYFAVAHPHPGFVYAAPPIYNGVVVPIAPPASSSATATSATPAASCSRKVRKKRRRNAGAELSDANENNQNDDDDAQLTDESFEGSDGGEAEDEAEAPPDDSTYANDDEHTKPKPKPCVIDPNNPSSEHEINQNPTPTDSNLGRLSPSLCKINNKTTTDIKVKKPLNLSGLGPCPLTGERESTQDPFCLQISPTTLEPGSPDSFNTTQSVAGSEIVGSVSDDLMNRTTSIDEVEEDLPIEDENENGRERELSCNSSPLKQQEIFHAQVQQQQANSTIDSTTSSENPNPNPVPGSSPITISKSDTQSPSSSPAFPSDSGANEPSPSPESTFERQIEPPTAESPFSTDEPRENEKTVRIPLESLYPTPELQVEEKVEEEHIAELDVETQKYGYAYAKLLESQSQQQELHSLDRVRDVSAPIILKRERDESKPKESSPEQSITSQAEKVEQQQPSTSTAAGSASGAAAERPKSITLAVTEWLKTAGEDALTPAAQIIAQFKSAAAAAATVGFEDNDGDIDSEEEGHEGELQREGDRDREDRQSLTDSEENQKNAYGNPWVLVSSSKKNRKAAVNTRNQRNSGYGRDNWQGRQHQQRPFYYSNQQQQREQQQQESGPSRRDSRDRDYSANAKNGAAATAGRRDGTSSRVASSSSHHNYSNSNNYGHSQNSNTHRNYYNRGYSGHGHGRDRFSNPAASLSLNLGERERQHRHERGSTKSSTSAATVVAATDEEKSPSENRKDVCQSHVKVDEEDSGLDLSSPEHHTQPAGGALVFPGANSSGGKQEERSANASISLSANTNSGATANKKKRKGNKQIAAKPLTSTMDDEEKSGAPLSSSSFDEATFPGTGATDSEAINCDPQNYAKYYQFGVVLEGEPEAQEDEEEDMKDHGIGSGSSTPNSTTPPQTPKIGDDAKGVHEEQQLVMKTSGKKKKKKKNQSALLSLSLADQERASFINMSTAPVDMSKVIKTCDFYETKMSILMKSKSKTTAATASTPPIAVQEEDEEIGTFDPDSLKSPDSQKSSRVVLWKGAGRMAQSAESSTPPEINEEDYKEFVHSVMKKNAAASSAGGSGAPNLYVNSLSLAAELVYAANASKVKLPDSWDLPEPPLPDYESPPPPNLLNYNYPPSYSPVFSHLTPREKLIRTQLTPYGFPPPSAGSASAVGAGVDGSGNPISTLMTPATQQAVCCNIQ